MKALAAALAALRRVWVFELAGVVAIEIGVVQWSVIAAWIVAGVALLAKSLEIDLSSGSESRT